MQWMTRLINCKVLVELAIGKTSGSIVFFGADGGNN